MTATGQAAWDQEVAAYVIALSNGRKSAHTIRSYRASLQSWARFLADQGADLDPRSHTRRQAAAYLAHLLATGTAATAKTRLVAVSTFYRWMASEDEGVIPASPFRGIDAPRLPAVRVPVVRDDEFRRLVDTTAGRAYEDRRDRALIMLMASTGLRRGEVAGLLLEDLDLAGGVLRVAQGKGERERLVAFHTSTSEALRLYLRARSDHRDADVVVTIGRADNRREGRALFLVNTGTGHRGILSGGGIGKVLERRARQAGLSHIHPHQLRHTWAHGALAGGMPEGAVMRQAGWRTRDMLDRYGADLAEERAILQAVDPVDRMMGGRRRQALRAV